MTKKTISIRLAVDAAMYGLIDFRRKRNFNPTSPIKIALAVDASEDHSRQPLSVSWCCGAVRDIDRLLNVEVFRYEVINNWAKFGKLRIFFNHHQSRCYI